MTPDDTVRYLMSKILCDMYDKQAKMITKDIKRIESILRSLKKTYKDE